MRDLTFHELREANVTRLAHFPGHSEADEPWSAADWMVALVGEVGELANLMKKMRRGWTYPGNRMPTPADYEHELADIQTYLDLLAAYLGIDLAEATIRKFNIVSERARLPDRL